MIINSLNLSRCVTSALVLSNCIVLDLNLFTLAPIAEDFSLGGTLRLSMRDFVVLMREQCESEKVQA